MASGQSVSAALSCKRCKSNVVHGLKCKNCENVFHISCAKRNNANFISSSEIICCSSAVSEVIVTSENDNAFFDAVEELSGVNKKVDIHIFNYVIRQKDVVIQELREKVELLNNHIQLLQNFNLINKQMVQNVSINEQKLVKTTGDKDIKSVSDKANNKNLQINKTDAKAMTYSSDKTKVTKNEVAAGIMQAETENKLHKYINIAKDNSHPSGTTNLKRDNTVNKHVNSTEDNSKPSTSQASQSQGDDWKEIPYRKRRNHMVIGNNKNSSIVKGVPKSVVLHVCRLDKETSCEELTSLLKDEFPEVKCEAVNSKMPEVYSSFRVTILQDNFRKAMNPKLWPYGACVSRFLNYHRKKIEPIT